MLEDWSDCGFTEFLMPGGTTTTTNTVTIAGASGAIQHSATVTVGVQ